MAVTAAVGVLPFRIAAISQIAFPIAGDGVLGKAAPNGVICTVKSLHTTAADDPVAQLILLYFFAHLHNGAKILMAESDGIAGAVAPILYDDPVRGITEQTTLIADQYLIIVRFRHRDLHKTHISRTKSHTGLHQFGGLLHFVASLLLFIIAHFPPASQQVSLLWVDLFRCG